MALGKLARLKLVVLNGVLLAIMGLAVVVFGVVARADAAINASVRRYAVAISTANLEAALAEISPAQREAWREWIEGQLGNVYEVRGVAVRSPSLLTGAGGPFEVSIVLDVNREHPGWAFQPTPRVPVHQVDGRWYLSHPPLADRDPETPVGSAYRRS